MENIYQTIKQQEPRTLFIIAKSQNKNVLQYSIQNDNKTIQPLWWMYEKEGVPKEHINFLEQSLAYGIHDLDNNHFYLSGYPKIILELKTCNHRFQVCYNNNPLIGIYIEMDKNSLLQSVIGIYVYYMKDNLFQHDYIPNT